MSIIQPTQNQIAIQSLQKWVEKVAANANTAELDSLELIQLQRLLATIMGTYKAPFHEITVPSQGIEIKDTYFGTIRLTVPVSEDEEGTLSIPDITVDSANDNTLRFLILFNPDETVTGFTIADALELFNSIVYSFIGGSPTMTMDEFMTLDYLVSVGSQNWGPTSQFILDIDLSTSQTSFQFKDVGFPSLRSPILGLPVISDLTAATATVTGTYDYTGRKTISEVGVILSQTGEADVEIPASVIASTFEVDLTNLVDDVQYGIRTYIKFSDGSGATSDPVSLEGKDLPNVTSVAASEITTTTATVGGSFVYDAEDGIGAITEVGVDLKISGGAYSGVAGVGTTSPFTVALTGLTLGSTYLYKSYVKIDGTKYYGSELTFDTLAE